MNDYILDEIEELLKKEGLIEEEVIPPKPDQCEWCGGQCKSQPLFWSGYHDPLFDGWYSVECSYLCDLAKEQTDLEIEDRYLGGEEYEHICEKRIISHQYTGEPNGSISLLYR